MTVGPHVSPKTQQTKETASKQESKLAGFVGKFKSQVEFLAENFGRAVMSLLVPLMDAPSGLAFCQFEQSLLAQGVELAAKTGGSFLSLLHNDSSWPAMIAAEFRQQRPSLLHKGLRNTPVRLLDGSLIQLKTPYLLEPRPKKGGPKKKVGQRGQAGAGLYPALEALGIRHRATPALQSEVARSSVQVASFEEAQQVLAARGCRLNLKTIQRLTLAVGSDAVDQQDKRIKEAAAGVQYSDEFAGKRLLIGVDGGRVRTRIYNKGRKRKSGRKGFEGAWKEPKLYAIYELDEQGKPIKEALPLYDATMGDADFAFELLVAELKLRGATQAKELIVTSDGAKWIWNRTDELACQLGLEESQVTRVLDFYHVCERLTGVMECCQKLDASEKKEWYKRQRQLLLAGRTPEVLRAIRQLCRGKQKKSLKEHLNYLEARVEFMKYKRYRELGIPRGSGATESAIRRVVNLRLKGAGTFWLLHNVDQMLHLRAALKSGRWEEVLARALHQHPDGTPPQLPAIPTHLVSQSQS